MNHLTNLLQSELKTDVVVLCTDKYQVMEVRERFPHLSLGNVFHTAHKGDHNNIKVLAVHDSIALVGNASRFAQAAYNNDGIIVQWDELDNNGSGDAHG